MLWSSLLVSWTLYKLCGCGVRLTWHSSLSHGLSIFQEGYCGGKDTLKLETNAESSKGPEGEESAAPS
ncbi:unnamed protein product [Lactuca virosa]|uniref:Uncharacterized protein n=1 Tax=Lactuca virosa TaxID=75947 RepID=A0AAU9NF38_9ASTR|nr:unnamed protein product [Lactuca virosa]